MNRPDSCATIRGGRPAGGRRGRVLGAAIWALLVGVAAASADAPDLSIGQAEYPDADAIVLRWEQHWTVDADGTTHRREHRWIKLLNRRPIRQEADRVIDFCTTQDTLTVPTARTHLPNGEVMPVPDYSFNIGATPDVAGWPAWACWQQQIVSFSGIEPGVTLELDHTVTTRAGVLPWVSETVRLNDEYPVVERIIRLTAPSDQPPTWIFKHCTDLDPQSLEASVQPDGAETTWSWRLGPFGADPNEPQAPRVAARAPHFSWTTATNTQAWVSAYIAAVESAAQPTEKLITFANAAAMRPATPSVMLENLNDQLTKRMNYVNAPRAFRGLQCRSADEVLSTCYANRLEAAALSLVVVRAMGLTARPAIAVDTPAADPLLQSDAGFADIVVVVEHEDGPLYLHPRTGPFANPGRWGDHRLILLGDDGTIQEVDVLGRGVRQGSKLHVTGALSVDDQGQASGKLNLELTGAFYDPDDMRTQDDQRKFIAALLQRLFAKADLRQHDIAVLSPDQLQVAVEVCWPGFTVADDAGRILQFADEPACLDTFPLPLTPAMRHTRVQLAGRFESNLDIALTLPDGWSVLGVPATIAADGDWGVVSQRATVEGNRVQLQQLIAVRQTLLAPQRFEMLSTALNQLRSTGGRTLMLAPPPTKS